jgi:hypothetical protein
MNCPDRGPHWHFICSQCGGKFCTRAQFTQHILEVHADARPSA